MNVLPCACSLLADQGPLYSCPCPQGLRTLTSRMALVREAMDVDPHALRVEVGGVHVGYVPRTHNQTLSPETKVWVVKTGVDPKPHVWLAY